MYYASLIAVLIALCAAIAAAGAFYVQAVRLRLERAVVRVTTVGRTSRGGLDVTVTNIGGRAAFDVELSIGPLCPGLYLEGLKAGGDHVFELEDVELPGGIRLQFTDPYTGRTAEERSVMTVGGKLSLGRPSRATPTLPIAEAMIPDMRTRRLGLGQTAVGHHGVATTRDAAAIERTSGGA